MTFSVYSTNIPAPEMARRLGYNHGRPESRSFEKTLETKPIAEGELWAAHWKMLSSGKVAVVLRLLREELEIRTSL